MNILDQTKYLCKINNIKPVRSRGQNFLIKKDVYNKIIKSAELKKEDTVLEVGPGLGFLTVKLAKIVKKVIAIELDEKLVGILQKRLKEEKVNNVEVVNKNVLDLPHPFLVKEGKYKVVANLPYNITSIFLRKFLTAKVKPELMVLMLQKEVAERLVAGAGKMSLLAVSAQFFAEPKIIDYVLKDDFWPRPEVDSAIVHLTPYPPLLIRRGGISVKNEKDFFQFVKIGFSAKRKMLKNNLAAGFKIKAEQAEKKIKMAGFSEKIRAQELSVKDWIKLFGIFK